MKEVMQRQLVITLRRQTDAQQWPRWKSTPPLHPLLLQVLLVGMTLYAMENPFDQLRSAIPPKPTAYSLQGRGNEEKALSTLF